MIPRRIVLTGGPGAGKTAVLEIARHHLPAHVSILHESASIIFSGGFPRHTEPYARAAAQRAIYHVQVELERIALETPDVQTILCDRGTIDGLAYWPGPAQAFFDDLHTTLDAELARYDTVIHLRTPPQRAGYHKTALRREVAREAEEIDERLLAVWETHPRRFVIDSTTDFMEKARRAIALIEELSSKVACEVAA